MNYTNWSIKKSNGMFYTMSKTPEVGFHENKYVDKETKEVVLNYHKEVPTLSGVLHSAKLKDTNFGQRLTLSLTQPNGDSHVLEIPVFNGTTDNISDYVKSITQIIGGLQLGIQTTFELNKTTKDKKGFLYANFYAEQEGEKIQWQFKVFGEGSEVPPAKQVKNKVTGKETWDFSDASVWLYSKLKEGVQNLTVMGNAATQNTTATTETPTATTDKAPVKTPTPKGEPEPITDGTDDLPF